jgi:hypothetical protein
MVLGLELLLLLGIALEKAFPMWGQTYTKVATGFNFRI